MYKYDNINITIERKYEIEKIVEEYYQIASIPDFNDLLVYSFGKTLLTKEDIEYLYCAFYLPLDKFKLLVNKYKQLGYEDSEIIFYLKKIFIEGRLNINIKKDKYFDRIFKQRIKDISEFDLYSKKIERKKTLKI
ncbi:MAG: hypothetical protein ACI33S_03720 [Bacilli bacterium]